MKPRYTIKLVPRVPGDPFGKYVVWNCPPLPNVGDEIELIPEADVPEIREEAAREAVVALVKGEKYPNARATIEDEVRRKVEAELRAAYAPVDLPVEVRRVFGEGEAEPLRTRSGRVLTDADFEALADEAEKGYDVDEILSKRPEARLHCRCWNEGQYGRVHREDCPIHKEGAP